MAPKLPQLSRLITRLVELAGAGLASAAGAFLFSQIAQPVAPPQALPPVQIIPASAELVQVMRKENAILIEQLLKEDGRRRDAEIVMPHPASPAAPKAIKAAPHREPKADKPATIESKVRLEELQLPANRPLVTVAAQSDVRGTPATAPNSLEAEAHPPVVRPRVFGWFGPDSADAPRPPMPVGELQLRSM